MKKFKIFSMLFGLLAALGLASCDEERELVIIEGNLPIKTTSLYMVGDATPNGWNIDAPTPLNASAEDALIFTWEGTLYQGEVKLCLATGSWDNPFIRPAEDQRAISSTDIVNETFIMHAGDPDEKWRVTEAGKYLLTFDLRNWTMSTTYLGGLDAPTIEPIHSETLYAVGSAMPCGWNIGDPTLLEKKSEYIFVYEGNLKRDGDNDGEFKCCLVAGDWGVPFVRPTADGVKISKSGIESHDFVFAANPDDKWHVAEDGKYRLTFDLEHWTIDAEYLGEMDPEEPAEPEAPALYIVGDATPNGWDIGNPVKLEMTAEGVYEYNGALKTEGECAFKACRVKGDWGAPFIHPAETTMLGDEPIVAQAINEYAGDPDIKWIVSKAGHYHLTFDLNNMTFSAEYKGEAAPVETPLYMVGDATPGGWDLGQVTKFNMTSENIYEYTGELKTGELKLCQTPDWGAEFIRPVNDQRTIDATPIVDEEFGKWANDPDHKWRVTEAGNYHLVFNLNNNTYSVTKVD